MPKSSSRVSNVAAFFLALGFSLATNAALVPSPALARGAPDSFADLAAQLSPTVVNISTTQKLKRPPDSMPIQKFPEGSPLDEFFKDFLNNGKNAPRRITSLGSGFVIDPSGLIVTNNHVIEGADQITVTFNDGGTLPAKVIGRDALTDLALLKVKSKKPLASVKIGDSDHARVGEWVMAIGNPFGFGGSVTAGIISARNRDIDAGPYDDFIQTDAPINHGNSGGPLFNMDGEVIGVNSAIFSFNGNSVGIAFSIPSAMVKEVVAQLKQYGEMRRGWLGVRIQQVTDDIAQSLGQSAARGALIANVTAGGPANKAGIQNGDLVIGIDGKPVADSRALSRLVADTPVGKVVPIEFVRKGVRKTAQVKLGRLQDDTGVTGPAVKQGNAKPQVSKTQPPAAKLPSSRLGLAMSPLTPELRNRYHIDKKVQGVVVTDVDQDSPAGDKYIVPGDVIVEVAQEPVKTPNEVTAKVEAALKASRNVVLFMVSRGGELIFVALNVAKG